ncbi:thioredoxin family protein [Kibdelosporangium lantanae]
MVPVLVLLGTLALATALGLWWRANQGRVRSAKPASTLPAELRDLVDPTAPVTLLQLSTTFCTPCRHTRVLLTDLAAKTEGLHHVDYDVTDHPEVATSLGVMRTPTTLAVDAHGVEIMRVGGVPKRETLLDALRPHLPVA